jgi:hypothetical protein
VCNLSSRLDTKFDVQLKSSSATAAFSSLSLADPSDLKYATTDGLSIKDDFCYTVSSSLSRIDAP